MDRDRRPGGQHTMGSLGAKEVDAASRASLNLLVPDCRSNKLTISLPKVIVDKPRLSYE